MPADTFNIVVCGDGFAGALAAMTLAGGLPSSYEIHYVRDGNFSREDVLYGSVTAPTAYEFLRKVGLDEPTLFMRSNTAFCYGTRYQDWPGQRTWMQGYAQPFKTIAGVPLLHHLTRAETALEPILVAAQAALDGRFAHPPEDANIPLSRAEYGYQFSVNEWTQLLDAAIANSRVTVHQSNLAKIDLSDDGAGSVRLNSGDILQSDLIVDCSGQMRRAIGEFGASFSRQRSVHAHMERVPVSQLSWPYRSVQADNKGWVSQTHLQNAIETLTIRSVDDQENSEGLKVQLGHLETAWIGNCVAIGQAACMLEPLTPAPMILLQRDVERLMELIPVSANMLAERREYNRRFADDVEHASLFQDVFYAIDDLPEMAFWQAAKETHGSTKLQRKLKHFENRGVLVRYDLEPFNDEDWTILHFGMKRRPQQYDLQAEQITIEEAQAWIGRFKQAIAQMVPRMPPHHVYVANMKKYFEKQNYGRSD